MTTEETTEETTDETTDETSEETTDKTTLHYDDERAEIHELVVGPYENNAYILRCKATGDAILIDAANEPEVLVEASHRLGVSRVLQTHGHWDHVQAVPAMIEAGYEVWISEADAPMIEGDKRIIDDGVTIEVGDLALTTVATPGHTPGSMCFRLEGSPVLFSGDTLFPGGPGNTSRPGGDFDTIIDSITTRIFTLPDDTIVMPGHGADTTIGTERPHLDEWIERRW